MASMLRSSFIALSRFNSICLRRQLCTTVTKSSFKSAYSLDNVYPNSNQDFLQTIEYEKSTNDRFSGFIPLDKIQINTKKSSGLGKQHVVLLNTKVELKFHLESAEWIPERARKVLLKTEKYNITKDGYLIISSDKSRKQFLNKADCLSILREKIWNACTDPVEDGSKAQEIQHSKTLRRKKTELFENNL